MFLFPILCRDSLFAVFIACLVASPLVRRFLGIFGGDFGGRFGGCFLRFRGRCRRIFQGGSLFSLSLRFRSGFQRWHRALPADV